MSVLDNTSDINGGLIFYDTGPTAPGADMVRHRLGVKMRDAWGVNIDLSTDTPQGQILDTWSTIAHDKNGKLLYIVEMWNPQTAEGRYQDNICKIYFHSRHPAQPTRVLCQVIGVAGVTIPAGKIVQDNLGRTFINPDPVVIGVGGTGEGWWECQEAGPIVVAPNTLTQIVTTTPGWDVITNEDRSGSMLVGSYEESRMALEHRRYDTVAKNAHGNMDSIVGDIRNLEEVIAASYKENVGDNPCLMGGVIVPGHSFFVSILGGEDMDIAEAIYHRKDGGCGYSGNTPLTYYVQAEGDKDTVTHYYVINRPIDTPARARITIKSDTRLTPGNIKILVAQRFLDTWYGAYNIPRIKPGAEVYAAWFYCSLESIGVPYELVNVEICRRDMYDTTIPPENFLYYDDVLEKDLYKSTQHLVAEYPQYFSFTPNGGFIIDDSQNDPPTTFTEWQEIVEFRMDENPTILFDDIEVIDLTVDA